MIVANLSTEDANGDDCDECGRVLVDGAVELEFGELSVALCRACRTELLQRLTSERGGRSE